MQEAYTGGDLLLIQDTSEINYNSINGLLKVNDLDIGLLSDNRSTGLMLHAALVVDATSGVPVGIGGISVYNRPFGTKDKLSRDYINLPIEEKSSFRWVNCPERCKDLFSSARSVTDISDREGDIFEHLSTVPNERAHVLTRSSHDRKLESGELLGEHLAKVSWAGTHKLELPAGPGRAGRVAELRVKWSSVVVTRPRKRASTLKGYPASVRLNVVELWEDPAAVPAGEAALHWRLLTTHGVDNMEQALQVARWYRWRWFIEDTFRVLKTDGFEVECSQLSTGDALKKLLVMCLGEAFKVVAMRQDRNGEAGYPASVCFDAEQVKFMGFLSGTLVKKGRKHQNPYQPGSLAWATWCVAVLGSWDPSGKEKRPPGVITIARGLKRFHQRFCGWKEAISFFMENMSNPLEKDV